MLKLTNDELITCIHAYWCLKILVLFAYLFKYIYMLLMDSLSGQTTLYFLFWSKGISSERKDFAPLGARRPFFWTSFWMGFVTQGSKEKSQNCFLIRKMARQAQVNQYTVSLGAILVWGTRLQCKRWRFEPHHIKTKTLSGKIEKRQLGSVFQDMLYECD